jgi:hypothetical protein
MFSAGLDCLPGFLEEIPSDELSGSVEGVLECLGRKGNDGFFQEQLGFSTGFA